MKFKQLNKCAACGKFRSWKKLVCGMQAEGDETWNECTDCMSEHDRSIYCCSWCGDVTCNCGGIRE